VEEIERVRKRITNVEMVTVLVMYWLMWFDGLPIETIQNKNPVLQFVNFHASIDQ
jgi:hypothetical protein